MKYLLILLLFTACSNNSQTLNKNGEEITLDSSKFFYDKISEIERSDDNIYLYLINYNYKRYIIVTKGNAINIIKE